MTDRQLAQFRPQDIESSAVTQRDYRDYWNIVLRRRWVIIVPVLLSVVVAGILCKVLPKSYRSGTLILVEDQKVPENYVQGIVERNIHQRVFLIQQQIMSRTLLGTVVQQFNLYPDLVSGEDTEAAIEKVRKELKVEMVESAASGHLIKGKTNLISADAFTVSFSHKDPIIAMKVTSTIASKFIEENLRLREQAAEGTTEFLDYEALRAQRDLEKKENEIRGFKSKHLGELPQQMEANLRALDRLHDELRGVSETIQRQSDRLAMVEKAVAEYQVTGIQNPSFGGLVAARSGVNPLFERLKKLKEDLVTLSAEYKQSYPDLVLTKQEIKEIEQELVELYGPEALKHGENYFDPYLLELKKQRAELISEITMLRQRHNLLAVQNKEYEQRVERAPTVEQELLILLRDYDNMMRNYSSLLEKRLNARVAENLEKREKGGQFRIIDPANLPKTPDKPNQLAIMIFGLVFGCGTGFWLAFMQERLNPLFLCQEEVERVLGPQVLAIIPDFSEIYKNKSLVKLLPFSNGRSNDWGKTTDESDTRIVDRRRLVGQASPKSDGPLNFSLIARWFPKSVAAEQYRVLATRLVLASSERKSTIVVVSSAVKGEGKTTTVINLGYTLARDLGKRTLLVDCDFQCPVLHQYIGNTRYIGNSRLGLADLLQRDISLETCFYQLDETTSCWVMPVGRFKSQPNELLKSQRLVCIFEALREKFDYILLNAPPILPLATMNILTPHADTLLLVVRAGSTPQQFVRRSIDSLSSAIPMFIILNAVGTMALPNYMSYAYKEENLSYFE